MTAQNQNTGDWLVDGRSVMGASHVRFGIPNQDAIAWSPRAGRAPVAALALSDGHGASPHFRSGSGAHIAVDAAIAVLTEALKQTGWIAAADAARARAVVGAVIARWRADVLEHVAVDPLGGSFAGDDRFIPYGATLIAAAASPLGLFVLQLGDGDLLLGTSNGSILRPLPDDEGLIGEQTYSLCQSNAEARVRTRFLTAQQADVDFVMLSTDGLGKSISDEDALREFAADRRTEIAKSGLAAVTDRLGGWLPEASRSGNGDDVTLGFMVRAGSKPTDDAV